jgi:opacity protein-like surface antigen
MRRLLVAGVVAMAVHGAHAADLPDTPILRGSFREAPAAYRTIWQGFYVGGQAGYGASNMTFGDFNSGLIQRLVADPIVLQALPASPPPWPALEPASHRSSVFGAFAGYNAQYENVVLGFEGSYMHGSFSGRASGQNTREVQNGATLTEISTESAASMQITDFGTLRVRGGYEMGSFLPYLFAGFGIGMADTTQYVAIEANTLPTRCPPGRWACLAADTNKQFVYGFTAGAGVDWMLFGGMFLRAEYEYLQFTSTLNTNIHSVRGGIGYKF